MAKASLADWTSLATRHKIGKMLGLPYWKTVFKRFWQDQCLTHAQALTYATLFALIPLLALVFAVARLFVQAEDLMERAEALLSKFLNPAAFDVVQKTLFGLLEKAQKAPLGRASMLIFLLMVVGLLMQTEGVMNRIFRVRKGRSIPQKLTVYWMALTLGPLLLVLPLAFSLYLSHFTDRLSLLSIGLRWTHLVTVIFFFTGLYFYLPGRRVKLQAAAFGGTIAGLLWSLSAYLYATYTAKAVAYSKLYGSLAAFPLFLLWLFISWTVTLFGAEVTAVFEERRWIKRSYIFPKLLVAVAMVKRLRRAFKNSEGPLNLHTLSEELRLSPGEIEEVLEVLKEKGIVAEAEEGFVLAKELGGSTSRELLEAFVGPLPETLPEEEELRQALEYLKRIYECEINAVE